MAFFAPLRAWRAYFGFCGAMAAQIEDNKAYAALIAAISAPMPMMVMTRLRL